MNIINRFIDPSASTDLHLLRSDRGQRLAYSLALFGLIAVLSIFPALDANARPEPPSRIFNIHLVDNDGDFSYPHMPGMRTTNDGRIAIIVEAWNLQAYLFVPEKLNGPWRESPRGTGTILSSQTPFRGGINIGRSMPHQTLCDTTTAFPSASDAANPYACGTNNANDCYDIVNISTVRNSDDRKRLVGRPMTFEVANPKTAQARIVDVRQGTDTLNSELMPTTSFFEPVTTEDGRLLVGRFSRSVDMTFTNQRNGQDHTGRYDLVYSLLEDDAEDCDVRGWKRWYPIAHAHHDPRMRAAGYGIAKFPLRTSEGVAIQETQDFGVTYPWMDRTGANVFFTAVRSVLDWEEMNYPNRCVPGLTCIDKEGTGKLRGVSVLGSWTQGKHIHMDNLLNNTDWGLPLNPQGHRMVRMYDNPANGDNEEIRVGSGGREKANEFAMPGRTNNSAIIDSIQNSFFQYDELKTATPRDVVWQVSNGKATDEFAFDDYLNPDSFIVSNMIASISQRADSSSSAYRNGWSGSRGFTLDVHLQNGATATPDRWRIPDYGRVRTGTGRVEPIALGGIHGRGFWLDGSNEISYRVEAQPRDPASSDWYVGLFVDSRFANDDQQRSLIRYPDGTSLRLQGRQQLLLMRGDNVVRTVTLPQPVPQSGWAHLALNFADQNRDITVHYNGYPLQSVRIEEGFFNLSAGDLIVGGPGGFRGWIDDFKVFAQSMNPEVACNHAGGTLIGINGNSDWQNVANLYPQSSHDAMSQRVSASGRQVSAQYACYTNYQNTHGIDVNVLPTGTVSVREAVNFPEGPIVHNQPRPDSTQNQFCLSCHTAQSTDGLSIEALAINANLVASDDPRRQPNQHLRMVHGNIPAGWLNGRVENATRAGREGFLLDSLLLNQEPPDVVNQAPEVVQPGNQTHTVADNVSVQIEATDDGESALQFSATNLPAGLVINESTGVISGTPTNEQESAVTVTVSDGELQSTVSFTWTIQEPAVGQCNLLDNGSFDLNTAGWNTNTTPSIVSDAVAGGGAMTLSAGWASTVFNASANTNFTFSGFARSPNDVGWAGWGLDFLDSSGNELAEGFEPIPTGDNYSLVTMNQNSPPGTVFARLWIYVEDTRSVFVDELSVRASGCVHGGGGNLPPSTVNPRNQIHAVGSTVSVGINAIDPEGSTLQFSASNLPAGLQIDAASGVISGTPSAEGESDTTVTVSDGALQSSVSFNWTILPEGSVGDACNMLFNGSFEEGTEGWFSGIALELTTDAIAGEQALRFRDGAIGTQVPAQSGMAYSFNLSYKSDGSTDWSGFGIDYLDASGEELSEVVMTLPPTSDYSDTTISGTVPDGATTIQLWIYAPATRDLTLDDLRLRDLSCTL